jgi:two-component system, OmpR family, sensor kinase
MTRRLTATIIGVVVATLLIVGAGTLTLANIRARHTTELLLRTQAVELAANINDLIDSSSRLTEAQTRRRLVVLRSFGKALNIDDIAVLTANRRGQLVGDGLPKGVDPTIVDQALADPARLVSGNTGNTVYAAAATDVALVGPVVVVITRTANAALGASVRLFLLASFVTLLAAAVVATWLGRRLTAPIRAASAATQRVAAGRLDTRLPEPSHDEHHEMAELARSINAMAARLERSQILEQQFLLSISHDLRTPLTSIRGYAEAITDGQAPPQQAAAVISKEATRLERLVADLLDLAKLQANGFTLVPATFDLAAQARFDVAGFAPAAHSRGVTLTCTASAPVTVRADPNRLSQIIANLVENALKYAKQTVTVSVAHVATHGVLIVDDDGPGIAAADLAYVFERLYVARSQPARHESSSGLGLAIVKELTVAMGGQVLAGANESGGARFSVYLPAA